MYVPEAIPALIQSLVLLSHEGTEIYFAYGRNRFGLKTPFCFTVKLETWHSRVLGLLF